MDAQLQLLKPFYGRKLGAADGDVGRVRDFYLDEQTWALRYVRADGGTWRPTRQFLFTVQAFGPHAFGMVKEQPEVLRVNLNRQKIEGSPHIAPPQVGVTREDEQAHHGYYGLPAYWFSGYRRDEPAFPSAETRSQTNGAAAPAPATLYTTRAMSGFRVGATDGPAGIVVDFLIDARTWSVAALVVMGGPWYARRRWYLSPADIARVDHTAGLVLADKSRCDLRRLQTMASSETVAKRVA